MPFEAHVTRVRDAMKTFIEAPSPTENVLLLRTAPELMQHAARLIKSLEADANRLFTAAPGDGELRDGWEPADEGNVTLPT